jgi:hypothetical protein
MSEDRDKLGHPESDENENDDVEAHKLQATADPESSDDDVEAHKLQ